MVLKKEIGFLVLCILLTCTAFCSAVVIELGESGWAMVVSPILLDIDDVAIPSFQIVEDGVVIELHKTFNRQPDEMGVFSPIVVEFQKLSENAVSKIIISDEYIINNTGVEWLNFHMQLMISVLNPKAGFDPDYIPDGHQLEGVSYNVYGGYNDLPVSLDFVDLDGHGVPPSPPGDDVFWPGYVEGQIVIVTDPEMGVGDRFGLKEYPTVPEPATLTLFGMGALLTLIRRRRRVEIN